MAFNFVTQKHVTFGQNVPLLNYGQRRNTEKAVQWTSLCSINKEADIGA